MRGGFDPGEPPFAPAGSRALHGRARGRKARAYLPSGGFVLAKDSSKHKPFCGNLPYPEAASGEDRPSHWEAERSAFLLVKGGRGTYNETLNGGKEDENADGLYYSAGLHLVRMPGFSGNES